MESGVDPASGIKLLHPVYLDTDMSMAFAAALAGGVALEEERLDRSDETSQAVKNLRGSLRLFGTGGTAGVGGSRETTEASVAASESRLVRRHNMASIFIALFDELRSAGRVKEDPSIGDVDAGDIVAVTMGPAVAPLRRVIDQVIRLLDMMLPMLAAEPSSGGASRPKKPGHAKGHVAAQDDGLEEFRQIHRLFIALRDDLEHSGLIDVLVSRDDAPSVVLTLDRQFVSTPTLELLHTSVFTVVGKVTAVFPTPDDVVNLYRRSVISLLPSLAQTTAWGLFTLLGTIAKNLDPAGMEKMAREAVGMGQQPAGEEPAAAAGDDRDVEQPDDIMLGDDVAALNPAVVGPAFQVLPLAICC